MRKLILQMGISIDGYVRGPTGEGDNDDWGLLPEDPDLQRWKIEWIEQAGAHLMGRVTYQEMASFWPTSSHAYAPAMNRIPKVVFSRSLEEATWPETRIARGVLADEIASLKREPGGDLIAYGGATLAQALAREGLVDEYRLVTQPVALGAGLPLFKDLPSPLRLELRETRGFPTGTVVHIYEKTVAGS